MFYNKKGIHIILFIVLILFGSCSKDSSEGITVGNGEDEMGNLLIENLYGEELVLYRVGEPLRIIHSSPEGFTVLVPTKGGEVLDLRLYRRRDVERDYTAADEGKMLKRWLVALSAQGGAEYRKTWRVKPGDRNTGELLLRYGTGSDYQVDVFLGNATGAKLATMESGQSYTFGLDYGIYNLYYAYYYSNPSTGERVYVGAVDKEQVNGEQVDISLVLNDNFKKVERHIPRYDEIFPKSILTVFNKNSSPITIYAGADLIERVSFGSGQGTSTLPAGSSASFTLKADNYVFTAKENGVTIDQLTGCNLLEGYSVIWNASQSNVYNDIEVINNTDYRLTIHDFEENYLGFVVDGHQSARLKVNSTILKLKAKTMNKDATVILNGIVSPWVIDVVYVLPSVQTNGVSNITTTTVFFSGSVSVEGSSPVKRRGFCFGTGLAPTVGGGLVEEGSGVGFFSKAVTDLFPNTAYYVRAFAENGVGIAYGNEMSFTTLPLSAPSVNTTSVSGITQTTAVGGGTVTSNGGGTIVARGVCWSTSSSPLVTDYHTVDGSTIGVFSSSINGLTANTTYYVRAYATNNVGTNYGEEMVFTTLPLTAPLVTTASVSGITQTTAVGGGNVTSNGGGTIVARGVCWSTSSSPLVTDYHTVDGSTIGVFSSSINGLTANTTYYVRAYATNSVGTAYGEEISFTTIPVAVTPPTVSTAAITGISKTGATGGGSVTSDGNAPVTARGVCWGTSQNPTVDGSKTYDGGGIGTYVSTLAGLSPSTTYYVRAYATNSEGTAYGNQVNFTTETPLAIGQSYGGGKIFYIDGTGEHGLIVATSDQSSGIAWWNGSNFSTGATGTAIGTGSSNTNTIVVAQGMGNYAAKLCYDLVLGGYSDWYLPSKDELQQLYNNRNAIGGLSSTKYWSSSEYNANSAWTLNFSNGLLEGLTGSKNYVLRVRAIRSF